MIAEFGVLWGKVWRFFVSGVLGNVLGYCLYLLLLYWSAPYPLAVTICYALGMLWGYLVNKYWSWQDESPILKSATLYILVYGLVYFCHMGFVIYLVQILRIKPEWAGLISFLCLVFPLFFMMDKIVYPASRRRR